MVQEEDVRRALKQVCDPEISINVVDLGMIYKIDIDQEDNVTVTMTFTAPNCPMADMVLEDARLAVAGVPGVKNAKINLTFEPPWTPSMMSEEALLETGLAGMDMNAFDGMPPMDYD